MCVYFFTYLLGNNCAVLIFECQQNNIKLLLTRFPVMVSPGFFLWKILLWKTDIFLMCNWGVRSVKVLIFRFSFQWLFLKIILKIVNM